jgi:hypothetical protein
MTWQFKLFAIGAVLYSVAAIVGGFRVGHNGTILQAATGAVWIMLGLAIGLGSLLLVRYCSEPSKW